MVVWVFAGGGESEVRGLIPFLEKQFDCTFERKTPIRQKPGPKPPKPRNAQANGKTGKDLAEQRKKQKQLKTKAYGKTGKSLAEQIEKQLRIALRQGQCDLILVVDDLDCHDVKEQEKLFSEAIDSVAGAAEIKKFVAFAAPELEAWLIADWDNTIAKDVDFRREHSAMRWWLSHEKKVPFDAPESFSVYDPSKKACREKLSDAIIESAWEKNPKPYSKAIHTPRLLKKVDAMTVSQKCPLFRALHTFLSDFCSD